MNIAIFNYREFNENLGGIEKVSVSLAKGLMTRGCKVVFIAVYQSIYKVDYQLPATQYILPSEDVFSQGNIEKLKQILLDENINIFLNQDCDSLAAHNLAYEATKTTDVKLVSALHYNPSLRLQLYKYPFSRMFSFKENIVRGLKCIGYKRPFRYFVLSNLRYLEQKVYKESDKIVLLSDKFIPDYCELGGLKNRKKICAINNCLSCEYEDLKLEKKNIILFCARLEAQKRPDRILYVWKRLFKKLPDWSLDIVGDGSLRPKLEKMASDMELERITFHGFKASQDFYKQSKILLMTSDSEGWGLALTEAMQYKCAPIAMGTNASVFDIIDDNQNGYIVPGVSCRMMAEKLYYLAAHPMERDQMALAAFKKASAFEPEKIVDKWMGEFINVLKNQ